MSLCEHGYTANWDCPICPCACGSGKPAGDCRCIAEADFYCEKDTAAAHVLRCPRQCSSCGERAGQAIVEAEADHRLLDPATAWPFPKEA